MQKHFYSHLIQLAELEIKLLELQMSEIERQQLLDLAHETIHHSVLETILDELSEPDKKHFLQLLTTEQHTEIWGHLRTRMHDSESKIQQTIQRILALLHQDLDTYLSRSV